MPGLRHPTGVYPRMFSDSCCLGTTSFAVAFRPSTPFLATTVHAGACCRLWFHTSPTLTFANYCRQRVPWAVRIPLDPPPTPFLAVAMKKNLKAALSLLHKGERRVCVNVLSKLIKAIYDDNSNGKGNPALVGSRRILVVVRKELRACVSMTRWLHFFCRTCPLGGHRLNTGTHVPDLFLLPCVSTLNVVVLRLSRKLNLVVVLAGVWLKIEFA